MNNRFKILCFLLLITLSVYFGYSNQTYILNAMRLAGASGNIVDVGEDGALYATIKGILDPNNSTVETLNAGISFTGTASDVLNCGTVFVNTYSDVASATDGLMIQQSSDGVNWDHDDVFTVPAGTGKNYSINAHSKYLRVLYTNGGINQGIFRLQTLCKGNSKPSSHRIQDPIIDDDDAELVKSVLTGLSDINEIFENVKTYRGALQVDPALVHQVGISEHAKRDLGGTTTFDVAASSGDTLINVAATTGFIVGDIVIVFDTSVVERSHFHIVAVDAGVSLTLSRPLDNDFEIGDNVQEVQIGMNVLGSLASPLSFKVQPNASERWQITRILITLLDQTAMDDARFGGLSELTNGVAIRVSNNSVVRTITHWKSNADLKDDMFDVIYSDKAPAGYFGLGARWTFTKAEFIADLDGANGDYLEVLIQDDLTGLDDFEVKAQGRLFGF